MPEYNNDNNYYGDPRIQSNQQRHVRPTQYVSPQPYINQQPFSTYQQPTTLSSFNNSFVNEQSQYQFPNNQSYEMTNNDAQPSSKRRIFIGIIILFIACALFLICSRFIPFGDAANPITSNTPDISKITSQFADVDTTGGTQSVVANNLDIDDEDYWIAKVQSQDVEAWTTLGTDEEPTPTGTTPAVEPSLKGVFFPQSKVMYSQLNMSAETRYVMNALKYAAETGKVYVNGDYSTYDYYSGGFRNGVDFAYDSFDYNMSDYPLTLAYLASPDLMEFYYSEKGFFMFNSGLFSTTHNFQQMYTDIDDRAQAICDECWDDAAGDEKQFIINVYHRLAQNMTYSDGYNDTVHANDIYGALIEGESKCAGMSGAMKYILDKKGIPNIVGFSDRSRLADTEEGHAWNIVYIDGQWLVCDLTIGSKIYAEYGGIYPDEDIRYTIDNTALLLSQDYYYSAENLAVSDSVFELERYAEQNIL